MALYSEKETVYFIMHPLRFFYRRLQGYLENTTRLEDLAKPRGTSVPLTSPLAFLFMARACFCEFRPQNPVKRAMGIEINRLTTVLLCEMPAFVR